MSTLFDMHSGFRWVVVVIAALTVIRLVIGLLGRQSYDRSSSLLMTLFNTSLDIQGLLGLIYLIWNGIDAGYWPRERFEHLAVTFFAIFIAHLSKRWANAPDAKRYRNDLVVVLVAMALIVIGVLLLPGGSARWEMS